MTIRKGILFNSKYWYLKYLKLDMMHIYFWRACWYFRQIWQESNAFWLNDLKCSTSTGITWNSPRCLTTNYLLSLSCHSLFSFLSVCTILDHLNVCCDGVGSKDGPNMWRRHKGKPFREEPLAGCSSLDYSTLKRLFEKTMSRRLHLRWRPSWWLNQF